MRDYKANYEQYKGESNKELFDKFIVYSSVEFYKKHLENYNEDFRFQMKEFKEGNMLFEVMERNVWNKAAADPVALRNYYNDHKQNYKWEASADVLVFNCSTEKIAEDAASALKAGKYWKMISEESNAAIQSDSGRYELTQISSIQPSAPIVPGSFSPIVKNTDGSASFVKYIQLYPAGLQRNFDDARGLVINDYQNVLEQKWLSSLRLKYPVKVNEQVFEGLLK